MSGEAKPSFTVQVCIDCADPHALVRFWAGAFGYDIEDHHDMVVGLLDQGVLPESEAVEIDGRKAFAKAAACRDADGSLPRLLFQTVPESKIVKNRVHLDVRVAADDLEATTQRVLALGATKLWDGEEGPSKWTTYADPEGNEFCIAH